MIIQALRITAAAIYEVRVNLWNEAEGGPEYAGLIPPMEMSKIETVVTEFRNVHDCTVSIRKLHPGEIVQSALRKSLVLCGAERRRPYRRSGRAKT